ncbi:hypothetical protein ABT127_33225 [Streptomyces sp. NPDC001904]|uniref:hypothetical protein n=1 Tax=Streptomyces sp. NPDC001904 TaxID=3154531 RepID=UPI003333C426
MTVAVRRTVGAVAATALLCAGAVACGGGSGASGTKSASGTGGHQAASQAVTAAYKKTAEAGSAKVTMTMRTPSSLGAGTMKLSGTMGWNPTVMDMTMKGSGAAAGGMELPGTVRMVMQDDVMYVDGGAAAARETDGKRWMKLDLAGLGGQAGGLGSMDQDPARQIAVLLDSPNLKHLGSATLDGERTEHYKGRLTVEEMMKSNDSLKVLGADERGRLLKSVEQAGIKDYDTELWVNKDDLPVRLDVTMGSSQGPVEMSERFSDYGAAVRAEIPPAGQTFDLMKSFGRLDRLGKGGLQG